MWQFGGQSVLDIDSCQDSYRAIRSYSPCDSLCCFTFFLFLCIYGILLIPRGTITLLIICDKFVSNEFLQIQVI